MEPVATPCRGNNTVPEIPDSQFDPLFGGGKPGEAHKASLTPDEQKPVPQAAGTEHAKEPAKGKTRQAPPACRLCVPCSIYTIVLYFCFAFWSGEIALGCQDADPAYGSAPQNTQGTKRSSCCS